jgi:hypothetical protein
LYSLSNVPPVTKTRIGEGIDIYDLRLTIDDLQMAMFSRV